MITTKIKMQNGELLNSIRQIDSRMNRFVAATMRMHAKRAEAFAKRSAPWTDQTGNARGSLSGNYEGGGTQHKIVVAHGVDYGIWLEVRFSGRYAVINPTIAHEGPEVMKTLSGGFGKIL